MNGNRRRQRQPGTMLLTNDWYYFTGAIDADTCQKLIDLGGDTFQDGRVDRQNEISKAERITGKKGDPGLDVGSRSSDITWINEQWVYDLIFPYMETANEKAGWEFDIKSSETPQLTRYEKGGFYYWHRDGYGDQLSIYKRPENKFLDGHVRKLSMTVLLNENFEGGDLQFSGLSQKKVKVETPALGGMGSIIVFPSFMEHRVAPITKGVRYSLVAWFLGPPFK